MWLVSHLYSVNYASSTVTSNLSAIGYAHKLAGVHDPTETTIIRQILKGYCKLAPLHDVHLPITLPVLMQLIASFKHTTESAYQLHFPFLHIGEITIYSSNHSNLIMLSQLEQILNGQGLVTALQLTISKYKHSDKEDLCCTVKTLFVGQTGYPLKETFLWSNSIQQFAFVSSILHFTNSTVFE